MMPECASLLFGRQGSARVVMRKPKVAMRKRKNASARRMTGLMSCDWIGLREQVTSSIR